MKPVKTMNVAGARETCPASGAGYWHQVNAARGRFEAARRALDVTTAHRLAGTLSSTCMADAMQEYTAARTALDELSLSIRADG